MPHAKSSTIARISSYLAAHPEPRERCEVTVATSLSSNHAGFRRVMRVISDLVYNGKLARDNVDNWAGVLSIPN